MKIFGTKNTQEKPDRSLYGCCEGIAIDLKDSDDDIVSSGILGEGFAVFPRYENVKSLTGGYVVEISSPVKGRVVDITHKPEVIILKNDDGLKVLVSFVAFSCAAAMTFPQATISPTSSLKRTTIKRFSL